MADDNGFARAGVDSDFGRGTLPPATPVRARFALGMFVPSSPKGDCPPSSACDRYYGDPLVRNPNPGPLEKGPFHAVQVVPGDLGTKGGLLTDAEARVLRDDGSVIGGLYAACNCLASVMGHTSPGPGSTLGPAAVFGMLAARHASHTPIESPFRGRLDAR